MTSRPVDIGRDAFNCPNGAATKVRTNSGIISIQILKAGCEMVHFYRSMFFPKTGKHTGWLAVAVACTVLFVCSPALYQSRLPTAPDQGGGSLSDDLPDGAPQRTIVEFPDPEGTTSSLQASEKIRPGRDDSFGRLLGNNDFQAVVDAYDRTYTNNDLEFSRPYRDKLLDHASGLNQGRQYELAAALLDAYLAVYYSDVEALILQARVHRNAGQFMRAIESFQQARVNEHRPGVSRLILNQANIVIGQYAQNLRHKGDRQGVTELYQWLTQSQPSVPGYHIGLANAYAAQQRYDEAVAALRYVQHDVSQGGKARSLIRAYTALSAGG